MVGEPKRVVAPSDNQRYRELASKLRGIARQSRLPSTRQKILDFALRLEGAPIRSTGEAQPSVAAKRPAKLARRI